MNSIIQSLHVGLCRDFEDIRGKTWRTALLKEAVTGPRRLFTDHLEGDEQADRAHHGGEFQALLVYAASRYADWRSELPGLPWAPGQFGENLSVTGMDEESVCVEDIYRIGPDALVQVTGPRRPCATLSRRWGVADLDQRVRESGRTGWYLRVLKEGGLEAGMELALVERPLPTVSVGRCHRGYYDPAGDLELPAILAASEVLEPRWKAKYLNRVRHGDEEATDSA